MIQQFIDIILHMDTHLAELMVTMGPWLYVVVFLVIFAETGLVVTPFLPGDSFLFALGALSTVEGSTVNVWALWLLLTIAGIIGDGLNYHIGKFIGPKIFNKETSWFFNKKHLLKTQEFYESHGAFTIVVARFLPIIRTFAPFVAGIGKMQYRKFVLYNIFGAFLWVSLFLFAGYFFGNMPLIKQNFHVVIFAIIIISVLPLVYEFIKSRRAANT